MDLQNLESGLDIESLAKATLEASNLFSQFTGKGKRCPKTIDINNCRKNNICNDSDNSHIVPSRFNEFCRQVLQFTEEVQAKSWNDEERTAKVHLFIEQSRLYVKTQKKFLLSCQLCHYYDANSSLQCAVHPAGSKNSSCADFRQKLRKF